MGAGKLTKFLQKDTNMKAEEQSKLEERVIAFFDNSLSGEESDSLLREVAASPEKRALFEGHEVLSRLIASAREPMEAPLEVKRSIAEKIPGMLAFLPSLFGVAETAPVLTENSGSFLAFFTRMSFSTATIIGGAVAFLVTSAILIKNNIERQPAHYISPKITLLQTEPSINPAVTTAIGSRSVSVTSGNPILSMPGHVRKARLSATDPPVMKSMIGSSDNVNLPPASDWGSMTLPIPTKPIVAPKSDLIPTHGLRVLSAMPLVASEGVTIRPYFTEGERYVTLNSVPDVQARSVPVSNELIGVEFGLGDRYAFHIQGGKSSFAAFSTNQSAMASEPIITSMVSAKPAWWSTVGVSYLFQTFVGMPLILSGDAGAVWFATPGVMTQMGAATEIPIFDRLLIRPSLTYDAVYTTWATPTRGIFVNPVNQNSMWSVALGFNLSVVVRY